jgi:hypothetical protein
MSQHSSSNTFSARVADCWSDQPACPSIWGAPSNVATQQWQAAAAAGLSQSQRQCICNPHNLLTQTPTQIYCTLTTTHTPPLVLQSGTGNACALANGGPCLCCSSTDKHERYSQPAMQQPTCSSCDTPEASVNIPHSHWCKQTTCSSSDTPKASIAAAKPASLRFGTLTVICAAVWYVGALARCSLLLCR